MVGKSHISTKRRRRNTKYKKSRSDRIMVEEYMSRIMGIRLDRTWRKRSQKINLLLDEAMDIEYTIQSEIFMDLEEKMDRMERKRSQKIKLNKAMATECTMQNEMLIDLEKKMSRMERKRSEKNKLDKAMDTKYRIQSKMLKDLESALPEIYSLNTVPLQGWNDTLLHKFRKPLRFDKSIRIQGMQCKVFRRFYELYFQGKVSKEDEAFSIVADAIALAQTVNGDLWKSTQFRKNPFYTINQSKEEHLSENVNLPSLVTLIANITPAQRKTDALFACNEKNQEFYSKISSMIRNLSNTKKAIKEEVQLKRLTGFLALTLMRASTKNAYQLGNAFLETQYRTNLNVLTGWPSHFPFSPPCKACIKICVESFLTSFDSTRSMFALLASEYVLSKQPEYQDPAVSEYLWNAVLADTAGYGLGIIELLQKAVAITKLERTELRDKTYFNMTRNNWNLIEKFFKTYHDEERPQYGFNWARIIHHEYLKLYAPKEMLPLAGIFAGIIEQQQGPGIWNAHWAKGKLEYLSEMRMLGKYVFEMTREDKKQKKYNDENKLCTH